MFRSFNSIIFYTCLSFYYMVRAWFIMSEKEDLNFGWVYVILGILFCTYFLINMGIRFAYFDSWVIVSPWGYLGFFEFFVIFFVMVLFSLVLVVFGLVLVAHGEVWVARLSGVLCVFLLICYLGVMIYPFIIVARQ